MRHKKKGRKLGRTASHRKATLQSLALAIIENKEIKTTLAKAKEASRHVEKLITFTKQDTVHARRLAYKELNNHQAVKVLFDEIGPAFEDRSGGYTRVIKLGQRIGDGAEVAILQLVGFESMDEIAPMPKKASKTEPKKDAAKEDVKTVKTEQVETIEDATSAEEISAEEVKAEAVEEAEEKKAEADPKVDVAKPDAEAEKKED